MKKGKSITLLTIVCVLMALLIAMTFATFSVGVKNYNGVIGAIELDYDLKGGTAYTLTLAKDNVEEVEDIDEVIKTLEKRMNALGYQTYSVTAVKSTDEAVKDYDIRIEAKASTNKYGEPDTTALTQDINVAAAYGELKFYGGSSSNPTDEILTDGAVIKNAKYAGIDAGSGSAYYRIEINFTDYATKEIKSKMSEGTFYLKVTLGETTLMNSELSSNSFSGSTLSMWLDGSQGATESDARRNALQISSGGLAYKYDVSDGVDVSAPYGENAALISAVAIYAVAILIVVAFFVLGKGYGFISGLTLILFLLIEALMLIAVPGVKLSLGGVFGIILSTILTADGLMIIYRRITEEFKNGKMTKTAVKNGFRRSTFPILGACVAAAAVALCLFLLTTGTVKGFAITFGIGAVVSYISTMLFARMFASLILPITGYGEKFLNLKREEA